MTSFYAPYYFSIESKLPGAATRGSASAGLCETSECERHGANDLTVLFYSFKLHCTSGAVSKNKQNSKVSDVIVNWNK